MNLPPPPLLVRFAKTELCTGLSLPEVESLFELCELRTFHAGQAIFREGQAADSLWIILEGDVSILREDKLLAEVGPDAVLGELSLLRAVPHRSATAICMCGVTAIRLPGAQFRKRLKARDPAALVAVSNLAHQMAERLVAIDEKLVSGGRRGLSVARTELRRVIG